MVNKKSKASPPVGGRERLQPEFRASDMVFFTAELFELIMENADMGFLLVTAQRVCKAWNRFIAASPNLQRQLFFRPNNETLSDKESKCSHNPLLYKHFKFTLNSDVSENEVRKKDARELSELSVSDLSIGNVPNLGMSMADMRNSRRRHMSFVRKGASWRRMLVSQPPPRQVCFLELGTESMEWEEAAVQIKTIPDGLRMGELWDSIYRTIWTPYVGSIYRSDAIYNCTATVLWRLGDSNDPVWCSRSRYYVKAALKGIDTEFVIASKKIRFSGADCGRCHVHKHKKRRRFKCWNEGGRYLMERQRASTSWMFRSDEYDETGLLPSEHNNLALSTSSP